MTPEPSEPAVVVRDNLDLVGLFSALTLFGWSVLFLLAAGIWAFLAWTERRTGIVAFGPNRATPWVLASVVLLCACLFTALVGLWMLPRRALAAVETWLPYWALAPAPLYWLLARLFRRLLRRKLERSSTPSAQ